MSTFPWALWMALADPPASIAAPTDYAVQAIGRNRHGPNSRFGRRSLSSKG